jgi:hypothetical protein
VAPSYATLKRRPPAYAKDSWRRKISAACAAHAGLGRASLVLYDVSVLFFETDEGDGFREPGYSKERRLDPQITIGLLTGQDGFPLMVSAFEGNKAVLVTWNHRRVSMRAEEVGHGSFAAGCRGDGGLRGRGCCDVGSQVAGAGQARAGC